MIRQLIKEYLSFTQKERVAVIVLIGLILLVYLLPQFLQRNVKLPSKQEIEEFKKLEQQLAQAGRGRENDTEGENDRIAIHAAVSTYEDSRPAQLFYFDPNTLEEPGWKRLGLRDKTIGTILKYRSKGGRFYRPEDLKKIYGLRPAEYERLEPFVRVAADLHSGNDEREPANARHDEKKHVNESKYVNEYKLPYARDAGITDRYKRKLTIIDINAADTAAFISLPGIGSKLAARIVLFRERLGGFYGVDQLSETYGLPDSTFQKIRSLLTVSESKVKKIDINTADIETLKQHPYIKWNIAKAIVAYRDQHGGFKNLEELLQIGVVDREIFQKVLPYLRIGE